jgi:hypothetical protein
MKLYLISQSVNNDYDTYDAAVVAALDEESARNIHPHGDGVVNWTQAAREHYSGTWARTPEQVKVEYIGDAKPGTQAGVICASYNAG